MVVSKTRVTVVNIYFFLILIFFCGQWILFGCSLSENKGGELSYKEKHKNGILYIDIFKRNTFIAEIQTKASIYQKYEIKIISDKDILLKSSDVGLLIISEIKPKTWECLEATEYTLGEKKIFVVFKGNVTMTGSGNIYDQITLICLDGKEIFNLDLNGSFSRYEKFLEIINSNTFFIDNGKKRSMFRVNNGAFNEIKKHESIN